MEEIDIKSAEFVTNYHLFSCGFVTPLSYIVLQNEYCLVNATPF